MELSFDIGQGLVKGEWLEASLLADDPSPISSRISPTPQHVFAFASIKCDLHSEARPLQIPVTSDRARGGQASQRAIQTSVPRLELVENSTCEFLCCTKMVNS